MITAITATWLPSAAQAEPASTLTKLLVQKGVISESEASQLDDTVPFGLADLLVAKGVITEAEASGLDSSRGTSMTAAKTLAPDNQGDRRGKPLVRAKEKIVDSLVFSARIQNQFDALSTDYDNAKSPRDETSIFIRRLYFGARASLGDRIEGHFNSNFGNGADGSGEVEKAVVNLALSDFHTLTVGYRKTAFGIEETTSSGKLPAVERSVGTRYFTEQLHYGLRYTGVYFSGSYDSGLYFDLGLTDATAGQVSSGSSTDSLALWARGGWEGALAGGALDAGVATGWIPDTRVRGREDTVWNVYSRFTNGPFSLLAEVLGATLENARPDGSDAKPVTLTFIPSWKLGSQWELVTRFSHVDTDGGVGADISSTLRRAPETGSAGYNTVDAWYFGGNWYINGQALKLSAGYEWAKFEDNLTGTQGNADVNGFRTQLQLQF